MAGTEEQCLSEHRSRDSSIRTSAESSPQTAGSRHEPAASSSDRSTRDDEPEQPIQDVAAVYLGAQYNVTHRNKNALDALPKLALGRASEEWPPTRAWCGLVA